MEEQALTAAIVAGNVIVWGGVISYLLYARPRRALASAVISNGEGRVSFLAPAARRYRIWAEVVLDGTTDDTTSVAGVIEVREGERVVGSERVSSDGAWFSVPRGRAVEYKTELGQTPAVEAGARVTVIATGLRASCNGQPTKLHEARIFVC